MRSARNYSAPYGKLSLRDYIQQPAMQLAVCWKLVAKNGRTVAATSHTQDLTLPAHPNIKFLSTQGVVASAVDNELGLSSAGMEVDAMFIINIVDEESIAKGVWDGAYFEVFMLNPEAPAMGEFVMYAGFIGELKTYTHRFKAEGRPLSAKAAQEIGSLFTPKCTVLKLGDARCKVNLNTLAFDGMPIKVSGTVTSSGSNVEFTDANRVEVTKLFDYGIVEFTSGILNGVQAEVKNYAGLPEGVRQTILSDKDWKCSEGFASMPDWKLQSFDDSGWSPAYEQGYLSSMPWASVTAVKNFTGNALSRWIWIRDTVNAFNSASVHPPCAFRRTFVSPSPVAQLIISADNKYTAYVNGVQVSQGFDWRTAQVVNLTNLSTDPLVPNVLAVECENYNYSAFVIAGALLSGQRINNPAGLAVELLLGRSATSGSGGTFRLQYPLTREIPVGTTYTAIRGCDREWQTCKNSFGNIVNFRGFPFVPGLEKVYNVKPSISG